MMAAMTRTGELPYHTLVSVRRIVLGFLLGAVPAVAVGLAMGLSRPVRAALMPLVSAVYPIPKIAVYPLIIFYLGIGEASKIGIVAVSIFFLVLLSTMAGVLAIDPAYFRDRAGVPSRRVVEDVRHGRAAGRAPADFHGAQAGDGVRADRDRGRRAAGLDQRDRLSDLAVVPDLRHQRDVCGPARHGDPGLGRDRGA